MTAMNLATMPRPVPLRSMALAVAGGLACALAIGKVLPVTMDTVSGALAPLCATAAESSPLDKVEPIGSYALPTYRASASPSCACSTVLAGSRDRTDMPAR